MCRVPVWRRRGRQCAGHALNGTIAAADGWAAVLRG